MISDTHDTFKMRTAVFLYYLIGLVLTPLVITCLGMFDIGWDIATHVCAEAVRKGEDDGSEPINMDDCVVMARGLLIVIVVIALIIQLYFAFNLKLWANMLRE